MSRTCPRRDQRHRRRQPRRAKGNFREVPVGEFLLGHRGEGGEVAPMPKPPLLVHNGTFLVMRKLQQEVVRFRHYLKEEAERMMKVPGCLPDKVARNICTVQEYLAAKMMGRWKDGSPVDLYPDAPAGHQTNAFFYHGDEDGARCPLGAHVRRANPRDSLGFAGQIVNRRRMLRRGITYGEYVPEDASPTSPEAASRARHHVPLAQCQHRAPVRVHPEAVDELRRGVQAGRRRRSDYRHALRRRPHGRRRRPSSVARATPRDAW